MRDYNINMEDVNTNSNGISIEDTQLKNEVVIENNEPKDSRDSIDALFDNVLVTKKDDNDNSNNIEQLNSLDSYDITNNWNNKDTNDTENCENDINNGHDDHDDDKIVFEAGDIEKIDNSETEVVEQGINIASNSTTVEKADNQDIEETSNKINSNNTETSYHDHKIEDNHANDVNNVKEVNADDDSDGNEDKDWDDDDDDWEFATFETAPDADADNDQFKGTETNDDGQVNPLTSAKDITINSTGNSDPSLQYSSKPFQPQLWSLPADNEGGSSSESSRKADIDIEMNSLLSYLTANNHSVDGDDNQLEEYRDQIRKYWTTTRMAVEDIFGINFVVKEDDLSMVHTDVNDNNNEKDMVGTDDNVTTTSQEVGGSELDFEFGDFNEATTVTSNNNITPTVMDPSVVFSESASQLLYDVVVDTIPADAAPIQDDTLPLEQKARRQRQKRRQRLSSSSTIDTADIINRLESSDSVIIGNNGIYGDNNGDDDVVDRGGGSTITDSFVDGFEISSPSLSPNNDNATSLSSPSSLDPSTVGDNSTKNTVNDIDSDIDTQNTSNSTTTSISQAAETFLKSLPNISFFQSTQP